MTSRRAERARKSRRLHKKLRRLHKKLRRLRKKRLARAQETPEVSLQWLTSKLIRREGGPLPGALSKPIELGIDTFKATGPFHGTEREDSDDPSGTLLTSEELAYLEERWLNIDDVRLWALILMAPESEEAAYALFERGILHNGKMVRALNRVPLFVLNFLLRRRNITASALQTLLTYTCQLLVHRRLSAYQPPGPRPIGVVDDEVVFVLFVRLCRHARKVWPRALPSVAAIISSYILHTDLVGHTVPPNLSPIQLNRATLLCNRALSLLALPTTVTPLKSASFQQRAQFDLIRAMVTHTPPIPVNREGYVALTNVLLRMKKTPQERDWARLKSRSWPPFKTSRTRLDDWKDEHYGTSRAGRSIRFMQEYGYPLTKQNLIMKILSGWHPDGSPTIQTRTTIPRKWMGDMYTRAVGYGLIAAAIRATRTLEEAWACFLIHQDSPVPVNSLAYHELFKKILSEQKRCWLQENILRQGDDIGTSNTRYLESYAGDNLRTTAAPESPAEAIYIPRPPPSVEELWDIMIKNGVNATDEIQELLVSHAPTFKSGLTYWKSYRSKLPGETNSDEQDGEGEWSMTAMNTPKDIRIKQLDTYPALNNKQLVTLLSLLLRFPSTQVLDLPLLSLRRQYAILGWSFRATHPLIYAWLLLEHYQPRYLPAWNKFLVAVGNLNILDGVSSYALHNEDHTPRLLGQLLALHATSLMDRLGIELDTNGFSAFCRCMIEAALATASWRHSNCTHGQYHPEPRFRREDSKLTEAELRNWLPTHRLRRMFSRLVRGANAGTVSPAPLPEQHDSILQTSTTSIHIPTALCIPNPAELHDYVRVLGLYSDYEGILNFVEWMVSEKENLAVIMDAELNGQPRFRRLLTSVRVFLECPHLDWRASRALRYATSLPSPATAKLVALVRHEIESVEEWGGWPSDMDVNAYCRRQVLKRKNLV